MRASDLIGLPPNAAVTIDVDLNNNGVFTDAGETAYATGALTAGGFAAIALPFSATGTYNLRARVTDLAGNQGTSPSQALVIIAVTNAWTLTNAGVRTSALADGSPLAQLGDLQVSHPLDLDISPGSDQSANPALVYNSSLVAVHPIVQATLQTDNAAALPATVTATLTWNGNVSSPVSFSTAGFHPGDLLTLAVQDLGLVSTTGAYPWSLSVAIPGHANVVASGVAYIRTEDASQFGAGWTLSNLNRLVAIPANGSSPAGQLWLYGSGEVRFFQGATGALTSPGGQRRPRCQRQRYLYLYGHRRQHDRLQRRRPTDGLGRHRRPLVDRLYLHGSGTHRRDHRRRPGFDL